MILEIVKYGNPVLREKGREVKEVDDKIKQLAEDMIETMRAAHGVGLAAQQIGVLIQLTVIDVAGIEDRPSAMYIDDKEGRVEQFVRRLGLDFQEFAGRPLRPFFDRETLPGRPLEASDDTDRVIGRGPRSVEDFAIDVLAPAIPARTEGTAAALVAPSGHPPAGAVVPS